MSHAAPGMKRLLPRPARVLLLALLSPRPPRRRSARALHRLAELRHLHVPRRCGRTPPPTTIWQTGHPLAHLQHARQRPLRAIAAALKIPMRRPVPAARLATRPSTMCRRRVLAESADPLKASPASCHGPAENGSAATPVPTSATTTACSPACATSRSRPREQLRRLPPEPSNPRSSPPAIRNFSSSWTGRPSPKTLAREGDGTAQGLARRRAVALREMSAQINREKTPAKARALGRRALAAAKARRPRLRPATLKSAANVTPSPPPPTPSHRVAEMEWSHDLTRQALQRLAKTHTEFADAKISRLNKPAAPSARPRPRPPHRAAGQSRPRQEPDLKELFALAQSLPTSRQKVREGFSNALRKL